MIKTLTNQTIALAGLSQSVQLVRGIARTGVADAEDLETCVASLFKINADNVPDVYGGLRNLRTGLAVLERQLGGAELVDAELARYAAALMYLERKYHADAAMQRQLRLGLERATAQAAHFGIAHENVLASLAGLYQNTISRLNPRIVVVGEQVHLQSPANANKIRALLLAGIRAAWLWRQCGGSRLGFLFNRGKLRDEARRLSEAIPLGFRDRV